MTLITVGVVVGAAAFVLWLLYTVIWRAVRRGMQEFEFTRPAAASPALAGVSGAVGETRVAHHRLQRLQPVPDDVVPDYPPSDWV